AGALRAGRSRSGAVGSADAFHPGADASRTDGLVGILQCQQRAAAGRLARLVPACPEQRHRRPGAVRPSPRALRSMIGGMLEGLNPQRQAAATLPAEHALVLAGAGSGKTRVLTTRMAWLIQAGQVGPHGLLAVTFTNKAAREMLTRLSALLPINTRGMWVGTFHGLCNRLLRAHHREAGLPQAFQILDSADQLSAIKRMLKAAGIDDERFPPRDVQRMINSAKEDGLRPGDLDARDSHARRLADLYQRYQDQCEREGVVDFGELLLRAYELLQREAPIREHYQRRFQQILVDEFQDTNVLQYRWLMLLAGAHTPVFAVGDDDQS